MMFLFYGLKIILLLMAALWLMLIIFTMEEDRVKWPTVAVLIFVLNMQADNIFVNVKIHKMQETLAQVKRN